jgi:hypothetical protein
VKACLRLLRVCTPPSVSFFSISISPSPLLPSSLPLSLLSSPSSPSPSSFSLLLLHPLLMLLFLSSSLCSLPLLFSSPLHYSIINLATHVLRQVTKTCLWNHNYLSLFRNNVRYFCSPSPRYLSLPLVVSRRLSLASLSSSLSRRLSLASLSSSLVVSLSPSLSPSLAPLARSITLSLSLSLSLSCLSSLSFLYKTNSQERLAKRLARSGIASRREAEKLIEQVNTFFSIFSIFSIF